MNKILQITALFLLLTGWQLQAQISSGGVPRSLPLAFKQAVMPMEMPSVNNDILRWENNRQEEGEFQLKPLTFAHAFEVEITPLTHGAWNRSADGWWVWQMQIRSEDALSLNLLFEDFRLPAEARLFLYTPDQQEVLGAYTADNNSDDGIFQVSPLPGDVLMVQYELPEKPGESSDFTITRVNHDFLGILKYVDKRRPMTVTAGECNKDINCELKPNWDEVKNSVCRIMVMGKDLCTGTLINNTSQNKRPFVLTANHCISSGTKASGSLFLFNYESPYCGPLDGDVTNSLSGSKLKATLDSLDFALVELNTPPPASFRPYFAGWNRDNVQADTLATVHHPQGDIKKISIDYNKPFITTFLSQFTKDSFWKILKWDVGTTEIGSSGGPLFNRNAQVIGTLSGGAAVCGNPINDFFARFDKAWSYKSDSARQLKYWLDPLKQGTSTLAGKQFNTKDSLCGAFTNLREGDNHGIVPHSFVPGNNKGYWTGTNNQGITEIADRFDITDNLNLKGLSIGVGKRSISSPTSQSYISVKIYNFNKSLPELIYTRDSIYLRNLVADAMNYIPFPKRVVPDDTFMVAINLEKVLPADTIAIYQSMRTINPVNTFWLKKSSGWIDFINTYTWSYGSSLAFELVACNLDGTGGNTHVEDTIVPVRIYPNPTAGRIDIEAKYNVDMEMVRVHNLLGQTVSFRSANISPRHISIDITGNSPGIYLVSVRNGSSFSKSKVLLISH